MARRRSQNRKLRTLIVIFTEGVTEKIYFGKLSQKYKRKIKIETIHDGNQGLNAVEEAEKTLGNSKNLKFKDSQIEQVYLIFDKDHLSLQNLREAKKEADRLDYKIGFSNESFELWILSHFQCVTKKHDNKELKQEISKQINRKYDDRTKTDDQLISSLVEDIDRALKNTSSFSKELVLDENPYTNLGWLIKEIYEL